MRVLVVSTHRSDKAHYAPLLRLLRADSRFEVVTDESCDARRPDVAIVLGDRREMLERAIDYVEARVPLVHLHGGEHTYGSLDERWRYAITAIADWHCVATDVAKAEVMRYLVTVPWASGAPERFTDAYRREANNVVLTGAPGLDGITENRNGRWGEVLRPFVLVAYNPAIDAETTTRESQAIRLATERSGSYFGWIEPNGDRYSELIEIPKRWNVDRVKEPLGPDGFHDLLSIADALVGNTSAGIIEAPSFGLPFVNVGDRQKGRLRGPNVIDVATDPDAIVAAIERAVLDPRPPKVNPYGDGHASARIRDVLLGMA